MKGVEESQFDELSSFYILFSSKEDIHDFSDTGHLGLHRSILYENALTLKLVQEHMIQKML